MVGRYNHGANQRKPVSVPLPIWQEVLAGVEMVFLRVSPVFWGYGIPHGDGSGVVLVPGFLGSDFYLTQLRSWLRRIGYDPRYSGIGMNAECPNLLIRLRLNNAIQEAYKSTQRKIHLSATAWAARSPARLHHKCPIGSPR
jgi:hypothetical protein